MYALVAQLDRAPDFGSGGLRFKSLQAHHIHKILVKSKKYKYTLNYESFYFIGAIIVFYLAFHGARKKGTLVNIGE